MRITPNQITELKDNEVFVFGSNSKGHHSAGAAWIAMRHFGAVYGQGDGLQGQSFAINTMSGMLDIKRGIFELIHTAKMNEDKVFLVTQIGCGIAGRNARDIAPLFKDAIHVDNIYLPQEFWDVLFRKNIIGEGTIE